MQAIAVMTSAELISAERGDRRPRVCALDVIAALALGEWDTAHAAGRRDTRRGSRERAQRRRFASDGQAQRYRGLLCRWLLERGASPNARWSHWDSDVTPLHLAVLGGHADIVRVLLNAGADARVRDSRHDSDAIGWAAFLQRQDIVQILEARPNA